MNTVTLCGLLLIVSDKVAFVRNWMNGLKLSPVRIALYVIIAVISPYLCSCTQETRFESVPESLPVGVVETSYGVYARIEQNCENKNVYHRLTTEQLDSLKAGQYVANAYDCHMGRLKVQFDDGGIMIVRRQNAGSYMAGERIGFDDYHELATIIEVVEE